MPWHIANAALGVWWAGFDVGRIRGTVHGDGTTAVAAEITAHELPADMIASDHAAWSSRTGLAELASAVPQLLFRADDDGRHATLIVSGDCIVELGAVGDQPRLPTLDPVENPYPFAGEHITRTHAEELFEVDREPTVSYIFGARVRAVAATAPAHRVVRCNRAECSNDPFGPGWVPVGWFAEPARAVVPGKIVTDTRVEILDPIGFVGSTAQIADSSTPTLDALANTLNGNPSILVVEVDAYAASRDIAQARADTVVAALVARGIAPGRLLATGGVDTSAQPPAPELVIVKRAP